MMEEPAILREFRHEDLGHVVRWAESDREDQFWSGRPVLSAADVLEWHRADWVCPYVMSQAGTPVAYGQIWVDREEGEVELARLVVAPAERRRGLGRKLVDALLTQATAFELPVAFAEVPAEAVRRVSAAEEARFNEPQPFPCVRAAFLRSDIDRVRAQTYEENLASRRVLEKTGLRLVRRFRMSAEELASAGTYHQASADVWDGDDLEYELRRSEWSPGAQPPGSEAL